MPRQPRLPKKEHFANRINECLEAGLTDKANYYKARLDELNKPSTEDVIREFIESHTKNLSRGIVATPSDEYLDDFTKACGADKDKAERFLLVQMAKQYGAKLIIDELSNLIDEKS
tara:strand:- start:712 stop:1059 length:348 start_codon:yes stop_codon:yes gene_type:complete